MSFKSALMLAFVTSLVAATADRNNEETRKLSYNDGTSCMKVIVLGSGAGPTVSNLAGAGTVVTFGTVADDCRGDATLQFDVGRGTVTRYAEAGLGDPTSVDAVFFTHMHSDHTDDLSIFMHNRWINSNTGPVDIVCAEDATVQTRAGPITTSCKNFVDSIGVTYIESGEVMLRMLDAPIGLNPDPDGPATLANVILFPPKPNAPEQVWASPSGDVTVDYITSNHVGGHASYRVNTPAGKVVVGGDASNDETDPANRNTSTSAQVELLCQGSDILVHSTTHPVLAPGNGSSFPPNIYNRQSSAGDLGALTQRTGIDTLIMTHMIPPLGVADRGLFVGPGLPLNKRDYRQAARRDGGFKGRVVVSEDLTTIVRYA